MPAKRMVALLRGINVGGNKRVPMKDLAVLAGKAGFANVSTYINSGNVVFETAKTAREVESILEAAIAKRFKFEVPVIARTASEWAAYAKGSPFPSAAKERPALLQLGLSKLPPREETAALLRAKASTEKIEVRGDAIWIDYAGGVGRSKLSPAVLDKAAASSVTMRNWKTVLALAEMLSA